jgi:beta-N-acetylhexosaminidase
MKQTFFFALAFLIILPKSFCQDQATDSLDIMIGQMIMVGLNKFDDKEEKARTLNAIRQGRISGIILFEKDLKKTNTQKELSKLVWELQEDAPIPLFMGIDEEGGKVNRLKSKYGFPKTVSAQYLGEIDNLDSTRHYAFLTAGTLSQFGFNVNYAPTVDVNINPANPVIGGVERSYSGDYHKVVEHAQEVIRMHDSVQLATVLKHFPGHGSSDKDTHLGIADVSETWLLEELYPYKALLDSGLVRAVMSSHIVNRTLDERMLPATLSDKMIQGILRDLLGFEGVVFSDDMHMGAISKHYGFKEAVIMAIQAGVDVLMFSNNIYEDEQTSAYDLYQVIRSAVTSGQISRDRIEQSYQRIMALKGNLGLLEETYINRLEQKLNLN